MLNLLVEFRRIKFVQTRVLGLGEDKVAYKLLFIGELAMQEHVNRVIFPIPPTNVECSLSKLNQL